MICQPEQIDRQKRLADFLRQLKPGDLVEVKTGIGWVAKTGRRFDPYCEYRTAPAPCLVNGVEVYPLREKPEKGAEIWVAEANDDGEPCCRVWTGTDWQQTMLRLGLLHTTEEAAQAHLDAITSTTRVDR